MNIEHIDAEISFGIWVVPLSKGDAFDSGIGHIRPGDSKNEYNLIFGNKLRKVALRDPHAGTNLDSHLKRGCAHLAQIAQTAPDGGVMLKVVFFNGGIVEIGDIEVGIDERIEKTARRNGIRFKETERLAVHLSQNCTISAGAESFFLMMCGPAADADFEFEESADPESNDGRSEPPARQYREFSIFGERLRVPVEKRNVDKFKDIFFATKIIFKNGRKREGALKLARGKVSFSDYTRTGQIRAVAAGAMSKLTKDAGSYLKQWDEYGAVEGEMLLAKAKSVGRIEYHRAEKTEKGVKFFIFQAPSESLSEGDEMELTAEEPVYIANPAIDWEQYRRRIEEEFKAKKENKNPGDKSGKESLCAKIIALSVTSIELDLPSVPEEQMFLVLSINGDKIQIERRMKAREAILSGRSANPILGLLIEEKGEIPRIQRTSKLKPLTPFVKDKIFGYEPTPRQIEAVDIALNTPDMALIQGPPGTGKTTVIAAILERLNEEYDKTDSIRGKILVSGFQHDAVENIVSRLSVNALPAVKFGKKSTDSEFAEDAVAERIDKWCDDIARKIKEKNPNMVRTSVQVRRLAELFESYSLCPSRSNARALLKRILDLPRNAIGQDLAEKAKNLLESFQSEEIPSDPSAIRRIRALRVTEAAFFDDGPSRAIDLLEAMEDQLDDTDIDVLEKASRWRCGKDLDFIDSLKALKRRLLLGHMPMPEFRKEKPREDVLGLVARVSAQLEKNMTSKNRRDVILAEFLHELEDNPDGVREAIEDYNFVFAATVQQSEGSAIRRAKTKFGDDTIRYDTVVIDEAARTSPRDLLIPMSQAEKRIILVGDHRQLPHVIDDEVAKALESGGASGEKANIDFIEKSMFGYLFRRMEKLEQVDHFRRTVTLDAQFRTHPLLGEFTSRNFYEKHDKKESYRSPLTKSFLDGIDEEHRRGCKKADCKRCQKNSFFDAFGNPFSEAKGRPAVWIDVPHRQGKERILPSHSRQRTAEAEVVAEYLHRWINSEEASKMSFGVISFYKAQVYAVYEALHEYDITERAQDGSWQIAKKYRFLKKKANGKEEVEERLRIGTVDAFQGMEFDIVFLSMVRSQDIDSLPPHIRKETDYQRKQQRIFGHLMSENRLCVSMSRQKRLLAIVGDASLIQAPIAVEAVPALKNYYDLCCAKGVVL